MRPCATRAAGDAGRGLCQSLFRQPWHADRAGRNLRRRADRGRGDGGFRALQRLAGREPRAGRLARCDVEFDFRQQELRLRLSARQDGRGGGARPRGGGAFGGFAPAVGLAGRDGFRTPWRTISCASGSSSTTRPPWPECWRWTPHAIRCAGVAAQLESIDYRLPRVEVAERYFLDYDSVAFSSKPVYSYQNPIPECRVYANGTIYRILLGTFNTKARRRDFPGRLSALLPDQRRGQVVLLCGRLRHAGRGRGGAGAAEKRAGSCGPKSWCGPTARPATFRSTPRR